MTQPEFDALRTTFPWTEQRMVSPAGGLVRVIDRNGAEVPIFTMTAFLSMITRQLAQPVREGAPA